MTEFIAIAAQPIQNGSIIKVGFMSGQNPDPKTGDMVQTGELFMQPHEWEAMRRLIVAGAGNPHLGVGIELLDGTRRAEKGDNVVEFKRNFT